MWLERESVAGVVSWDKIQEAVGRSHVSHAGLKWKTTMKQCGDTLTSLGYVVVGPDVLAGLEARRSAVLFTPTLVVFGENEKPTASVMVIWGNVGWAYWSHVHMEWSMCLASVLPPACETSEQDCEYYLQDLTGHQAHNPHTIAIC